VTSLIALTTGPPGHWITGPLAHRKLAATRHFSRRQHGATVQVAMVLIRRAEPRDAAGIAHVHVASWRTTYRGIVPDSYLDALDEPERAEHG
jgi:hypothetical protein